MLTSIIIALAALVPATFPGGQAAIDKYIADNLKYPEMAKEIGIEGIVPLEFTVKTDGTIGTIKVVRMIDPDLEQEAIRLVKTMPAWTPATDDGTAVESTVSLQIPFRLNPAD